MLRDVAAAHPRCNPIGPSNSDRGAGRDWWLTILTDAQAAAQASISGRRRVWGVAAQALALVGALEFQDGRADNAFAEALTMNMLEVEGQFAPNNLALLASARKLSGAGAIPTGAAFGPPNATVRIARARPASRTREYTARRPRDLHGAARGVRVKLEFSAPYWSLDQAKAWALTRHPELVSWAAKPANFKGAPVALAARIGLYLERARRQGQDVNAELWRTSGRPLPIESSSARNDHPESLSEHGPDESQRQEQPEGDESALARLPLFPIEDHLVELLRAGRIKSLGKRPSERRHQELSAADWVGLEIAELVGLSVAKSEATCLFVMLSQPDVLREFPALPIEPKSQSTERPDLMTKSSRKVRH